MALAEIEDYRRDMEAFLKMAKYPLIKHTDMTAEMREEAVDICITAVEKYQADMEKCTQVVYIAKEYKKYLVRNSGQVRTFGPSHLSIYFSE